MESLKAKNPLEVNTSETPKSEIIGRKIRKSMTISPARSQSEHETNFEDFTLKFLSKNHANGHLHKIETSHQKSGQTSLYNLSVKYQNKP